VKHFSAPIGRHKRLDLEIMSQPDDQSCGPTCLHAVYAYHGCSREHPDTGADDDLGVPAGHLAVLHGYDRRSRSVYIADPYRCNRLSGCNQCAIGIDRVLCAILLGTFTYDANLLIIQDPQKKLPPCQI